MAKPSSLQAGLKSLAKGDQPAAPPDNQPTEAPAPTARKGAKGDTKTVLVGANFHPDVQRALLLILADRRNQGRTKKSLLAEAINDLCAKYNVPQVANLEAED